MEIDPHRLDQVSWPQLIETICRRLVINQRELADRCQVSSQAVSAWHCGRRVPDTHARRRLLAVLAEAGIEAPVRDITRTEAAIAEPKRGWGADGDGRDVAELMRLFRAMAPARRRELLEYARFKAQLEP